VALELRLLLRRGTPFAIATVVDAAGTIMRPPGMVLVISQAGKTIGFNPPGPAHTAIRDLATQTLITGHDRLEHLEIEHDAASYIGLSGPVSLDVHATRVPASDPAFDSAPRYLDSGTDTVVVITTRGATDARPPQAVTGGQDPFELSARELEVARLVADGLSNPAIASALFISVPTVKTHVSHILAKLGLESRVQLAGWVAGHDLVPAAPPASRSQATHSHPRHRPAGRWHRAPQRAPSGP
jgi:DNA-binding CsgD family transcriptional regulator